MLVYVVLYSLFYFVLFGLGWVASLMRERSYPAREEPEAISLADLTVIIPVRNEVLRINRLIHSLKNQRVRPESIVFIDDYSDDSTKEHIEKSGFQCIPNAGAQGKKQAIETGVSFAQTTYILQLDGDVVLPANYFESLQYLAQSDMYVLPVHHQSKGFWQHLVNLDVLSLQALNTSLAGFSRPIVASGANLLYSKTSFERVQGFEGNHQWQSGDDQFLLQKFTKNRRDVRLIQHPNLTVNTPSCDSFKEIISQRSRWASKNRGVNDGLANFFGSILFLLQLTFLVWFFINLFQGNWKMAVLVFTWKISVDLFLLLPHATQYRWLKSWLLIPIYQFIWPIWVVYIQLISKRKAWR